MSIIYKIPSKIVFSFSFFIGIFWVVWFFTNSIYVGIPAGLSGLIFSVIIIAKPEMLPRAHLVFSESEEVSNTFYNWAQRYSGLFCAVISIIALLNHQITNTLELGLLSLLAFGGFFIINIVCFARFRKGQTSVSKFYAVFILIGCGIFCLAGIALIFKNAPLSIPLSGIYLLPVVIGVTIAFVINALLIWKHK